MLLLSILVSILLQSSNDVDAMLKDLDPREKVILLEEMLDGLYDMAGKIQSHLDLLDSIRSNLVETCQVSEVFMGSLVPPCGNASFSPIL